MNNTTQEVARPHACGGRRIPALLPVIALAIAVPRLDAATITLSGGCTMDDAIRAANTDAAVGSCPAGSGADTIVMTANIEITTAAGPSSFFPRVDGALRIEGGGFSVARAAALTSSLYFFEVGQFFGAPAGDLTLNDLRLLGPTGRGVLTINQGSKAQMNRCVIDGADGYISGLTPPATLEMVDCKFINGTFGNGEAVAILGMATIRGTSVGACEFRNNTSTGRSTVRGAGTLTVENCTFRANTSRQGTIRTDPATQLSLTNVNMTGNTNETFGAVVTGGPATIKDSTISDNQGSGLTAVFGGTATVSGTTIRKNSVRDCAIIPTDGGGNSDSDGSCGFPAAATGACCSAGSCSAQTKTACEGTAGATYMGDNVLCSAVDCTTGACCTGTSCAVKLRSSCTGTDTFQGPGTACGSGNTCPAGACCEGATCSVKTQLACTTASGEYRGTDTTCAGVVCGAPTAPVIAPIPGGTEQTVKVGDGLMITVTASDTNAADKVTLTATDLPAQAQFTAAAAGNPTTAEFLFAPTAANAGKTYKVTFTATDNSPGGLATSTVVTITVPAPVPTLPPWALVMLALLLLGVPLFSRLSA